MIYSAYYSLTVDVSFFLLLSLFINQFLLYVNSAKLAFKVLNVAIESRDLLPYAAFISDICRAGPAALSDVLTSLTRSIIDKLGLVLPLRPPGLETVVYQILLNASHFYEQRVPGSGVTVPLGIYIWASICSDYNLLSYCP